MNFLTKKYFFPSLIQASLIPTSTTDVREKGVKTWTSDKNLSSAAAIGQWARVQNSSFGDWYMTAFFVGHSWLLHLGSMNISQQILALDARYNAYRVQNNPQYRKYSKEEFVFWIQLTIFPSNIAWILPYVRTYCFLSHFFYVKHSRNLVYSEKESVVAWECQKGGMWAIKLQ